MVTLPALALLDSDRAVPAEVVLVSLVNNLDELAGPTVLAVDDYHIIDAPVIQESVTFLLGHLPPQPTIVITTRAEPPQRTPPAPSSAITPHCWKGHPCSAGKPHRGL